MDREQRISALSAASSSSYSWSWLAGSRSKSWSAPYLAEIGLVGKGPGRYNLYLGAAFEGTRLSKLYAEDLDHTAIVAALEPVIAAYAAERRKGERLGDFVVRAGFVAATGNGRDFHANTGAKRAAVRG